jgi:hypothetical protein
MLDYALILQFLTPGGSEQGFSANEIPHPAPELGVE